MEGRTLDSLTVWESIASAMMDWSGVILFAVTAVLVLALFGIWRRYGKEFPAESTGTACHKVPSSDHPAVLGYLWNDGTLKNRDMDASVLRLICQGVVTIERVPMTAHAKGRGRAKRLAEHDYRLTLTELVYDVEDDIDLATLFLLFETAGVPVDGASCDEEERGGLVPGMSMLISDVAECARQDAPGFYRRHKDWESLVTRRAKERGFFDEDTKRVGLYVRFGGTVIIIIACVLLFLPLFVSKPGIVALGVTGLVWRAVGKRMRRRSSEGNEIYAKLVGLRAWLRDIPKLKEADMADVSDWGELLVISVTLGVSTRVTAWMRKIDISGISGGEAGPTGDMMASYLLWNGSGGAGDGAGKMFDSTMNDARTEVWRAVGESDAKVIDGDYDDLGGGFGSGFGGDFSSSSDGDSDSDSGGDGGDGGD